MALMPTTALGRKERILRLLLRRRASVGMAGLALALLIAAQAYGQDLQRQITITAPDVNASVWTANAIDKVNRISAFEDVALATYLLNAYTANPSLNSVDALKILNQAQDEFQKEKRLAESSGNYKFAPTEFDAMNSMMNIVGGIPGVSPFTTIVKEAGSWAGRYASATLGPEEQVIAQAQLFNSYSGAQEFQAKTWDALYALASQNPQAGAVVNTFFSRVLNAQTSDNARTILHNNPDFAASQNIKAIATQIGPDGTLTTNVRDLYQLSSERFAALQDGLQSSTSTLQSIDQNQMVLIDYVADQRAKANVQAAVQRQQAIDQLKLDAADSGVYLLSTFARLSGDSDAARTIAVTGGAVTQIYKAVSDYEKSASSLGSIGSTLGSVVLTGNVVGAALNVMALFSDTGPSIQQVELAQIQAIRQQIADLSQKMSARFDRVDAKLDDIYKTMNLGMAQILGNLSQISSKIDDLRSGLLQTQASLNRLERNLYSYLDAASRRQFKTDISDILTYKTNHPDPMPYTLFASYANELFVWAVDHSKDSLEAGPSTRSFADLDIRNEMTSLPLENNVNYLVQYVNLRLGPIGVQSITTADRVVNPRDWQISAESYLRLLSDWPSSYMTISRQWDNSRGDGVFGIYDAGVQFENAVRAITLAPLGSGGELKANRPLFKALADDYVAGADSYYSTVKSWELSFKRNMNGDPRTADANSQLNLWGGAGQTTSYVPVVSQILMPKGAVSLPIGLLDLVPTTYKIGEQLGLGVIQAKLVSNSWYKRACNPGEPPVRPGWKRSRPCCDCLPSPIRNSLEQGHARISIELDFQPTGQAGSVLILKRTWTSPTITDIPVESCGNDVRLDCYQPWYTAAQNWTGGDNISVNFVPQSAVDATGDATSVTKLVEQRLKSARIAMQSGVYNELTNATGDINRSASILSGHASVLSAFISLGMSRSVESDDLLRSLLYGNQRLPDSDLISAMYAGLLASGADPQRDTADIVVDAMHARATAMSNHVCQILDRVESEKSTEPLRSISTTLERVAVLRHDLLTGHP